MATVTNQGAVVTANGSVPSTGVFYEGGIAHTSSGAMYVVGPTGAALPYVLAQSAVPYGIANTSVAGISATTGAFVLGTALNTTYTGGIWLYFPANAVSGDATGGFYWCVMSSTTAGIAYTNSTAATHVTGSGAGYTGSTSLQTAVTVTVPAMAMGANGSLRVFASYSCNNSAGSKTLTPAFGGTNTLAVSSTTSLGGGTVYSIHNRNSYSLQKADGNVYSGTNGQGSYLTKDTSIDQNITFALTLAVATDVLVLEQYLIELMPAV